MPWTTDSTGKSVWEGDYPDDTAPLPEAATATKAPPKAKPERVTPAKPWWEQLKDAAVDVVEDVAPLARYAPNPIETLQGLTQGKTPGNINRAINDFQYELNQLSSPETALPRLTHLATKNSPAMQNLPDDLGNTLSLGGAKATSNIAKSVLDGGQEFLENVVVGELPIGKVSPVKRNPVGPNGPVPQEVIDSKPSSALTPAREGVLDQALDNYYAATQESKVPSEMTPDELAGDDMRSSLVLNAGLSVAGGAVFGAIGQAYPFLGRAIQYLDPSKAQSFLGALGRVSASNLIDEPLSTFLDDNTGGTLLGLFGADADPVKPGMSRTEASKAAFWPNFVAAMAFTGALGLASEGLKKLPNLRRSKAAQTETSKQTTSRAKTTNEINIQEQDESGKYSFTKETLQPEEAASVEARVLTDDDAPATTGDIDPTTIQYDPAIPEVDAAYRAIEGHLSNDQLAQMHDLQMQGVNTAVAIEQVSSPAPAANAVNPDMAYDDISAPSSSLAQSPGSISDRFGSVSQENLLSLASPQNSPALSEAISDATGKDWPNFDRFDILSGIERMEANDGRTVMAGRMMGQPMMLTSEIEVDPQRFQFKQGTDAKTGVRKGNSLDGVVVWSEDMEGIIQVWVDPMDGKTYVVNGHNRKLKAEELGIPSVPVKYINAPTAEIARSKGALANIADDKGTAFDAAKYIRDKGITDLGQLKVEGVPLKSGLALKGMALSKLPDNIFQDAIDGILDTGKAIALGGSGLDETGMQAAVKALKSRDMSDTTFNEVLQQARSAPTVQGDQVDLFGNTDMLNLMVQKGELAGIIRKDLNADKSLMSRTAKNAKRLTEVGNEIDTASTATLADDTNALLKRFDADKYMDGPTSQLLNEGALQIENGANVKVVADRIRRQLIEAAEGTSVDKPPRDKFARLKNMSSEQLQAEKARLEKKVLGDRAKATRQKASAEMKAKDQEVDIYLEEMPGSNRPGELTEDAFNAKYGKDESKHPQAANPKDEKRVNSQLKQDEDAREALAWIEENGKAVEPLPRQAQIKQILATGAKKGEVRPSTTPILDTPDPGKLPEGKRADVEILEGLDNEARLAEEWAAIDDAVDADRIQAERKAIGYDEMTFDEKKGAGMLDGLEEANKTEFKLAPNENAENWAVRFGHKFGPNKGVLGLSELQWLEAFNRRGGVPDFYDLAGGKANWDRWSQGYEMPEVDAKLKEFSAPEADKPIAVPEAAINPITEQNRRHVAAKAQFLFARANSGRPFDDPVFANVGDAQIVIERKGALLNLDKIPGVDVAESFREPVGGPATDNVRKVLMDFYGLKGQPRKLSDQMRGQLNDLGQSIGQFTRTVDGVMDRQTANLADRLAEAEAEQKVLAEMKPPEAEAEQKVLAEMKPPETEFVMPQAYAKSKPTFGRAQLKFQNDLDRAVYMLQSKTTGAKADKKREVLFAALKERGFSRREALDLGAEVKASIQDGIEGATGSRKAPQQRIEIEVPASTRDGAVSMSRTGPQLSRSAEYNEGKFRKSLEEDAARKSAQDRRTLLALGLKLPSDIAKLTQISEGLGREMVAGLKDAARISGLDPLRIQYLDTVDTRKLFGDENSNGALEAWDPDAARFARDNPGDPLMDIVDGETGGIYVPRNFEGIHRSMIYLAMGPSLDSRLGIAIDAGTPMGRTAYHEAFHGVQDWLNMMYASDPKTSDKAIRLGEAMESDEAIAEMTALVKGDPSGNYQEGMALNELQAEAFATWYNNRKARMKSSGLQAAFQKIKKFINTLRRKWKFALGKDPSYVDVFELAAAGKIADKGNQAIARLRPEQLEALKGRIDSNMDAMLPELTDRVQGYLRQKQADFDVLTDKLADDINLEGC